MHEGKLATFASPYLWKAYALKYKEVCGWVADNTFNF
jgi:hypothetical protein